MLVCHKVAFTMSLKYYLIYGKKNLGEELCKVGKKRCSSGAAGQNGKSWLFC